MSWSGPASELLDVTNRRELDEFLGRVVTETARPYGGLPADVRRILVHRLGQSAVQTLPSLAAMVGAGPRTADGRPKQAQAAQAALVYGLEVEGMSAQDRDFELAQQFVRRASAVIAEAAGEQGFESGRTTVRKGFQMFETGAQIAEYGEAEYGRRRRRRRRWSGDDDEYGEAEYEAGEYGEGEAEYSEGEYGEAEYGGLGEYGAGQYGEGESQYGEGEGEYGEGEGQYGEYGEGEYGEGEGEGEYGEGEGQYGEGEDEGEEQFLPLIPIVGKVLGGLLGGLMKESEYGEGEYGEGEYGEGETEGEEGEAEEQFLHKVFLRVLGQEAEVNESPLSEAQELEFAGRLLEVSNEQELDHFLGGLVNTIGKVVQGVGRAVNSPQGRALVSSLKPLAKAALPAVGGAIGTMFAPGIGTQIGSTLGSAAGSLFEAEMPGMSQEQQEFEVARQFVRMAASAARDVATAPPGAPPELVGELGTFRAARRHASPLYRRGLRAVSPLARRFFGSRYSGRRYVGRRYGSSPQRRYGSHYRGPGYRRYGTGYRSYRRPYGYGPGYSPYAVPALPPPPEQQPPEQPSEPSPRPGFRWVAVPIGEPAPTAPPAPPPSPEPPADASGPGAPEPAGPAQSEFGGGYGRRGRRRQGGYGGGGYGGGGYGGGGYGGGARGDGGGGTGASGRWVRRAGKIILLDT